MMADRHFNADGFLSFAVVVLYVVGIAPFEPSLLAIIALGLDGVATSP